MLCKKPYIVPIPGSRRPERLKENLGAGEIPLTAEEVRKIDESVKGMDLPVYGGAATVK